MVKKKVFAVGDRVGYAVVDEEEYEYGPRKKVPYHICDWAEDPNYGEVTDVLKNGNVLVAWDESYMDNTKPIDPADLLLEQELKDRIVTLDAEFKVVTKEISAKMKEAAGIIKEANKLAKTTGNSLANMYDAVRPLVNAMDASGWRSSSWGC